MTQDQGIEKVNNTISKLMADAGLGADKYPELIKKAESAAKSTKDYISIANEIKEMNDLAPQKKRVIEERRVDYTKYLDEGTQKTSAKQTISTNEIPSINGHNDRDSDNIQTSEADVEETE